MLTPNPNSRVQIRHRCLMHRVKRRFDHIPPSFNSTCQEEIWIVHWVALQPAVCPPEPMKSLTPTTPASAEDLASLSGLSVLHQRGGGLHLCRDIWTDNSELLSVTVAQFYCFFGSSCAAEKEKLPFSQEQFSVQQNELWFTVNLSH